MEGDKWVRSFSCSRCWKLDPGIHEVLPTVTKCFLIRGLLDCWGFTLILNYNEPWSDCMLWFGAKTEATPWKWPKCSRGCVTNNRCGSCGSVHSGVLLLVDHPSTITARLLCCDLFHTVSYTNFIQAHILWLSVQLLNSFSVCWTFSLTTFCSDLQLCHMLFTPC